MCNTFPIWDATLKERSGKISLGKKVQKKAMEMIRSPESTNCVKNGTNFQYSVEYILYMLVHCSR